MQTTNNDLKEHLTRYHQFNISVIGRKSGKTISIPVCGTFLMNWGEHMKNRIV
jgi:hypothetical protein